jgi:hypothetical protein
LFWLVEETANIVDPTRYLGQRRKEVRGPKWCTAELAELWLHVEIVRSKAKPTNLFALAKTKGLICVPLERQSVYARMRLDPCLQIVHAKFPSNIRSTSATKSASNSRSGVYPDSCRGNLGLLTFLGTGSYRLQK